MVAVAVAVAVARGAANCQMMGFSRSPIIDAWKPGVCKLPGASCPKPKVDPELHFRASAAAAAAAAAPTTSSESQEWAPGQPNSNCNRNRAKTFLVQQHRHRARSTAPNTLPSLCSVHAAVCRQHG